MLVRGGVDSAVCAALLHKALLQGDDSSRVQVIHIDNGFLRKDESEQVVNSLQQLGLNLRVIFLDRSDYYDWPKCDTRLIGTLMPDLIESASHMASSLADAVKIHHNDSEMVFPTLWHSNKIFTLFAIFPNMMMMNCAEEPFMEVDFGETQVLIRRMVDYANMATKEHALLNRIEITRSEEERFLLEELSRHNQSSLQDDCRTYSYRVALSSDQTQPNWNDLATFARLIPRVFHNFNRVCYVFGKAVRESVTDVTPTFLTSNILATSRKADYLANKIFRDSFSPRGWRQDG
ncbi:putative GMP synthase [Daphnia magna]|uniref:Putative GMP synthase n=1 Tax=Daphnia magna TaxID=35525 RepID=A0A164NW28_9CRUS|nr:putative GMP synthase [Daphnia magna]